jgi:acetoin utilization deacetylase AcuC-like enzyme/GNAT superfamily N-acetyltransferase
MSKPESPLQCRSRLAFDPLELRYEFGADHPLQAGRVEALLDLLKACDLWQPDRPEVNLAVRPATLEELGLVHSSDYLSAVQRLSAGPPANGDEERRHRQQQEYDQLAFRYGFGDGDTPAMPGMHEVAAMIAGGTLVALSAVLGLPEGGSFASEEERPLHVFHPGGGLHHAWANRASGFCVYNDAAIAIAHALRASEAKVLYIDFDAHHGDGVQRAFYDDPRVLTISLHETGRYLFPGSGDVLELGNGLGRGYSVNVPLEPFTQDDSYIEVIETLLPPLALSFGPDVLISNHGCDTHAWDPLTHLALTLRGIRAQARLAHELAHRYCQGRWIAVGGGGYDPYRVVPRAWSIVWAEMAGQPLPEELPAAWVARWRPAWEAMRERELEAQEVMGKPMQEDLFPTTFEDPPEYFPPMPRARQISQTNRDTVSLVRHLAVPPAIRTAFPPARQHSPLGGLFDLLHLGSEIASRSQTLETRRGPVLLRHFCPPSLVERLRPAQGLCSFARLPEREHRLLLEIARRPDSALALAHTPSGEIVGEVTLAPGDAWWEGLENVYEVAIEISKDWRQLGIARNLLAFALDLEAREDLIFFAVGLSWHWDTEGTGLSSYRYREMLIKLFGSQGFKEYPTNEPNIAMDPANVFLVRIGSKVDERLIRQFFSRVQSAPHLPRL